MGEVLYKITTESKIDSKKTTEYLVYYRRLGRRFIKFYSIDTDDTYGGWRSCEIELNEDSLVNFKEMKEDVLVKWIFKESEIEKATVREMNEEECLTSSCERLRQYCSGKIGLGFKKNWKQIHPNNYYPL